jgi:hypothetical protein
MALWADQEPRVRSALLLVGRAVHLAVRPRWRAARVALQVQA